jgi:hypothetical protein
MELKIAPDITIKEIQQDFHKLFPYLKIEFFKKPHHNGAGSSRADIHSPNMVLGKISGKVKNDNISFSQHTSVTTLETIFFKEYDLNVQVFRSSNNLWIETSLTDHWSLERQNSEGEEISKMHLQKQKPEDMADRDKWE